MRKLLRRRAIVVPVLNRRSLAVAAARAARSRSAAVEHATLEGRFRSSSTL
jgi:hypothetical protein